MGNKHGYVQKHIYRDVHIKHYSHKFRRAAIEQTPKCQIQIIFCIIMPIKTCLCCVVLDHSVMSDSLRLPGLQPTRLLCPWGFSRQEYWSGFPCPPPEDLPNPGIERTRSPTLQADSLLTEPPGNFSLLLIFSYLTQIIKMAWDMLEIC